MSRPRKLFLEVFDHPEKQTKSHEFCSLGTFLFLKKNKKKKTDSSLEVFYCLGKCTGNHEFST